MTARIKPNTKPDANAQAQLDNVEKALGKKFNIFTTLANSSAALSYYLSGAEALSKSSLSAALREQLALTVAGANACDYCASAHTTLGKKQKISADELTHNLSGKSSDSKTQAALAFAKKIVDTRGKIADSDLEAVRKAGYSEAEIVEIIAVVGINTFTNYFNHIAGTEVDFEKVSTASTAKAA